MFSDPFCTCSPLAEFHAVLQGTDRELCALHDAPQIAARRLEAVQAKADERRNRETVAYAEIRAEDARRISAANAERAAAAHRAALTEVAKTDPLLAALTDATGAATPSLADPPQFAGFDS